MAGPVEGAHGGECRADAGLEIAAPRPQTARPMTAALNGSRVRSGPVLAPARTCTVSVWPMNRSLAARPGRGVFPRHWAPRLEVLQRHAVGAERSQFVGEEGGERGFRSGDAWAGDRPLQQCDGALPVEGSLQARDSDGSVLVMQKPFHRGFGVGRARRRQLGDANRSSCSRLSATRARDTLARLRGRGRISIGRGDRRASSSVTFCAKSGLCADRAAEHDQFGSPVAATVAAGARSGGGVADHGHRCFLALFHALEDSSVPRRRHAAACR